MKFRTRLLITFLTIILLPLVLAVTAFLAIGYNLSSGKEEFGFRVSDYNVWIDPAQTSRTMTDEIFYKVKNEMANNPYFLEDRNILDSISEGIEDKSSYIIIRKNHELYYTGN